MIIAVFENRTQSLLFSRELKKLGVQCRLINTPRAISTSCGVSVEFKAVDAKRALVALKMTKLTSFRGFYRQVLTGIGKQYTKI